MGHIEDSVEAALPQGEVFDFPEEWRQELADMDIRKESPSSITNFLLCPLKWWLERYSPLPDSDEVNMWGTLGTFVHRVLEVFYSEPAHYRTEEHLNEVFASAWAALREGNEDEGIVSEELVKEFQWLEEHDRNPDALRGTFYNRARECIENIVEFDGDPSAVNVVSNERWVRMEIGSTLVRGKIDRVDRTLKGNERIIDYKTGKAPDTGKPSVLDPTFVPAGLYALMVTKMTQDDELAPSVSSVQLLYLKALKRFTIKITPEVLEQVDLLSRRVVQMMDDVAYNGKIVVSPASAPNAGYCNWCPASGVCPVWTDGTFGPMRKDLGI